MYTATDLDPLSHVYAEVEPSDLASNVNQLFQRSISSNSLYKTGSYCHSQLCDEFEGCAVRRVFSAGDLESASNYMAQRRQRSDSPLSISEEKSMIIEGMMKVIKYSPEEKKERIERYRSKRRLRNFSKKIQYECRKTLADSRTRVKGRFVRIEETPAVTMMEEKSGYNNLELNYDCEDYEGEEGSWINFLNYANSS